MKIALVCVAKDEDNYIKEWIDYNLKVGFDDIFIYEDEWHCNVKNDKVHLIYKERKNKNAVTKNPQVTVYREFCKKYWKEYDWAAFFDIDEFLCLKKWKNVKQMCEEYNDCPGIFINWRLFGDNNLKCVENNNYQVISRFTKCQKHLSKTGKTIVNFKILKDQFDMHCHNIQNSKLNVVDLNKNEVISVNNLNVKDTLLEKAYLNHYRSKTFEEFKIRSIRNIEGIGRPDLGWSLTLDKFDSINKNEIEDLTAKIFFNNN